MKNEKRHFELSEKFFKMGEALIKEGEGKNDFIISSTGNFMVLISGVILEEDDVKLFGELCSMFSAKKLIETQSKLGPLANMDEDELIRIIDKLRKNISDDLNESEGDNEK